MNVILKNLYQGENSVKMMIRNGEKIYQQLTKFVFDVDKDSVEFPASGGTDTLTITASKPWAMTLPSWLTASAVSGRSSVTITLTSQPTEEYLEGDIVITCCGKTKTISVVQGRDYSKMYLTIEALETGTLNVRKVITYSINDGTWTSSTGETALSLNSGDKVRFKGDSNTDATSLFLGNTLATNVYGNIMSLKYGDNFSGQTTIFILQEMFRRYIGLVDAGNLVLPATTLASDCYSAMFMDCTSLVTAPVLPATTLAKNCYAQMFQGCTSLVDAPELPVKTLTKSCYYRMFRNCTSLNYIKCLATDISASNCTFNWLNGVASTGTFVKNPAMSSWTTGNNGIPSGWSVVDA